MISDYKQACVYVANQVSLVLNAIPEKDRSRFKTTGSMQQKLIADDRERYLRCIVTISPPEYFAVCYRAFLTLSDDAEAERAKLAQHLPIVLVSE